MKGNWISMALIVVGIVGYSWAAGWLNVSHWPIACKLLWYASAFQFGRCLAIAFPIRFK